MNSSTSPSKMRPMDAKLKNKVLKACLEIKGRKNKLQGSAGMCDAIFDKVGSYKGFYDDGDYYYICDLVHYVSTQMFGESKHSPFISVKYRWTPRRTKVLDRLIEILSSKDWKKTVKLANEFGKLEV